MATLPPPMTTTRLPVEVGQIPVADACGSSSTADMTPWLSSPGMPVLLSVWAPMARCTDSHSCFLSSCKGDILAHIHLGVDLDAQGENGGDLRVQQLPGQAVAGNAVAQHTAQLLPLLIDRDLVAHEGQVVGRG